MGAEKKVEELKGELKKAKGVAVETVATLRSEGYQVTVAKKEEKKIGTELKKAKATDVTAKTDVEQAQGQADKAAGVKEAALSGAEALTQKATDDTQKLE